MLSFAIIVFREALEVAMVIGILLAGTAGIPRRANWVWSGLAAGLLGSIVVACFVEQISAAGEGVGQELPGAVVLLTAAVLIGFTVVWMRRHARRMPAQLRQVGSDIRAGVRPLSALSIVIGLSVLRDGSEVVLLSYGVAATGQGLNQLLIGGLLGLAAGTAVGFTLYKGLLRAAAAKIFRISELILMVLAAGMVSQAVGLLSAAGYAPDLVPVVWDTSAIISRSSLLGQVLHAMAGYTPRPSGMQIVSLVATLGLIQLALNIFGNGSAKPQRSGSGSAALAAGLLFFSPVAALAIDKIYAPLIGAGEVEIESRGRFSTDHRSDRDKDFKQNLAVGYAPNDYYQAEIYGIFEHPPEEDLEFHAVEFENRFQIGEQGENLVDTGLYAAVEYEIQEGQWELETRLLLEKQLGRIVTTANLIVERGMFKSGQAFEAGTALKSRYMLARELGPGLELHSAYGEVDEIGGWSSQEHVLGPAIFGELFGRVCYEVSYLLGISREGPDRTIRFNLEFELG